MDVSQQTTVPHLSDQSDIRLDNNICHEAFSNVDCETSDVRIQPTLESVCSQRSTPESQSTYESLDILTQVARSDHLDPYEELNTDVWGQIFPINVQQGVTIHLQPACDSSYQQDTPQTQDSEHNETRQILFDNDQDEGGNKCSPTAEEEQWGVRSLTRRPLPVVPLDIYEPLNKTSRFSNTNGRNYTVSPRICKLIAKIFLFLTALVTVVVLAVVITRTVLNVTNNKNIGKLNSL